MRVDIRVISEANTQCHWAVRQKRFKAQRLAVRSKLNRRMKPSPPLIVKLTKFGCGILDTDNLAGSFKAVRDEIAKWLGVDDGDTSVKYEYSQVKAKRGIHYIDIDIINSI